MRRSPIACRRAVQSLQHPRLQHVWIADELLDLAAARFFRALCPHQRRHGSHVPGPLEARRRANKRRMTVSANFGPHDSSPSPFGLGALFGFLRDRRKGSPHAWKYEPPSPPQDSKPLDLMPSIPDFILQAEPTTTPCDSPPAALQLDDLSLPQHNDQVQQRGQHTYFSDESALVNWVGNTFFNTSDSDACFQEFKSRIAHAATLSAKKQKKLIGNAFRSCYPSHFDQWRYSIQVVKHMLELELNPLPVLCSHKPLALPPFYTTQNQELLECLEKLYWLFPDSQRYFQGLYVRLAEGTLHLGNSTGEWQDGELLLLIRQLWQSACPQRVQLTDNLFSLLQNLQRKLHDPVMKESLAAILSDTANSHHHVVRLVVDVCAERTWASAIEQVLSCVPRKQLSAYATWVTLQLINNIERKTSLSKTTYKYHLRTWLELLHRLDTSLLSLNQRSVLFDLAMKQLTMHIFGVYVSKPPEHASVDLLVDVLLIKLFQHSAHAIASTEDLIANAKFVSDFSQNRDVSLSAEESLAILFSQMYRESLSYEDVVPPVLALLAQHTSLRIVLQLLQAMERRNLTICDVSAIDRLIVDRMSMVQKRIGATTEPQSRPRESQTQHAAYVLRACQAIFHVISRMASPSTVHVPTVTEEVFAAWQTRRQFRHILCQAQAHHALPLAYRDLPLDMTFQQQVDLIHQLAHHYSRDLTRTHLEAWRALYYLYRYLLNNHLPVGPLFSKAAVRVAIIRPLIENRFVSTKRLIWVCRLVAKVEGEGVARKIENDFWAWRGDVIKHAKKAYVRAGGNRHEKAHIGAMKRLGLT